MPQIFLIEYLRQKFVFMLWNQLYSPCFRFTVTRVFLLPRNLSDFCLTVMFRYYLWISKRKSSDISWFLTNFEGFLAPRAGLEPATSWLTVMRSTDWANEDYEILHKLDAQDLFSSPHSHPCNTLHAHYRLSYGGMCERGDNLRFPFSQARTQQHFPVKMLLHSSAYRTHAWTRCRIAD